MPHLNANHTQIHYQLSGDPAHPALLFSNSLGTDLSMWDAQTQALSDDFFIIRYDTRGHGSSSRDGDPFSLDTLGLDVLALMNHLSVSQVNFCGISMGGLIGQWLALHAPEKFSRLVIANTAAKIGNEESWTTRANTVLDSGMDPIADTAALRWFTPAFCTEELDLVSNMIEALRYMDAKQYAYCCLALASTDFTNQLNRITTPTLVIAGEFDPVTTVTDAKYLHQSIAGSTLAVLPASHLSNVEKPDAFNNALNQFMK